MTRNEMIKKLMKFTEAFLQIYLIKKSFWKIFLKKGFRIDVWYFLRMETRNCTSEETFFCKTLDDYVTNCFYSKTDSKKDLLMQRLSLNSSFVFFS